MVFVPSKAAGAFKASHKRRKPTSKLQLNSMMDLMTVILLFLIKSYSASGALIQASDFIDLPRAQRDLEPKKAVALIVAKGNPDPSKAQMFGVFEDMPNNPRQICDNTEMNTDYVVLPGLSAFLQLQTDFKEKTGAMFTGEVTIQCADNVPYDWLLKVINTCGQQEYATIDFVIIKNK